jgi:hypothetical protein
VVERMRQEVRRRLAAAVIVGMLTLGAPASRPVTLTAPPAVVRVQAASVGAQVWRELFPHRSLPN